MKKITVLFLMFLLPLTAFAQDKMLGEINKQNRSKPQKITKQELNSKLVNEWGEKEIKFIELKNGNLIPMTVEKSNSLSKVQKIQEDEWIIYTCVIAGVIIIIALIFILSATNAWDDIWEDYLNRIN